MNLKKWPQSQLLWFSRLVVYAIKSDRRISPIEIDYLGRIVQLIEDEEQRSELLDLVDSDQPAPLPQPPDLSPQTRAAVFTELGALLVADFDFDQAERDFLLVLSGQFRFSSKYAEELMAWCNQGCLWKRIQLSLLGLSGPEDRAPVIPVDDFSMEQRLWYAEVCVIAIVIDGRITDEEVAMLRTTLGFVENKVEAENLINYIKIRLRPQVRQPSGISDEALRLIYFEMITHFVLQFQMSDKEQVFIRQLASLSGLNNDLLQKSLNWWKMGLEWRKHSLDLVQQVELAE
ncbi:MAG: hypothetical protein RRB13_01085 [bacterium]|nr:hypothetical protein [bacterium]